MGHRHNKKNKIHKSDKNISNKLFRQNKTNTYIPDPPISNADNAIAELSVCSIEERDRLYKQLEDEFTKKYEEFIGYEIGNNNLQIHNRDEFIENIARNYAFWCLQEKPIENLENISSEDIGRINYIIMVKKSLYTKIMEQDLDMRNEIFNMVEMFKIY